jgi:hypothetical protein
MLRGTAPRPLSHPEQTTLERPATMAAGETPMMQIVDPARFDAFVQLLAQPDPADLPHRGHVQRCEGDPNRRETRLPRILSGWLQRRHMDVDFEETPAAATRDTRPVTKPGYRAFHLLRPTGTDSR